MLFKVILAYVIFFQLDMKIQLLGVLNIRISMNGCLTAEIIFSLRPQGVWEDGEDWHLHTALGLTTGPKISQKSHTENRENACLYLHSTQVL